MPPVGDNRGRRPRFFGADLWFLPQPRSGPLKLPIYQGSNTEFQKIHAHSRYTGVTEDITMEKPHFTSQFGDLFSSYLEGFSFLAYILSCGMFYMNCVKAWLVEISPMVLVMEGHGFF